MGYILRKEASFFPDPAPETGWNQSDFDNGHYGIVLDSRDDNAYLRPEKR